MSISRELIQDDIIVQEKWNAQPQHVKCCWIKVNMPEQYQSSLLRVVIDTYNYGRVPIDFGYAMSPFNLKQMPTSDFLSLAIFLTKIYGCDLATLTRLPKFI